MSKRTIPWFFPTYIELLMVLASWMFAQAILDFDIWWHLACGREFFERGYVMTVDDLSTGSAGTYWTPHYWFWACVAYQIYAHGGFLALLVTKGLLAALAVQFLVRLVREQGVRRELAMTLAVLAGATGLFSQFWNTRAHNASAFGVFYVTYLFMRARRTGKLPWIAAPLFMCLWTNSHGGFIFGIVIWGAFFAAACMRRLDDRPTPLEPGKLALLGVLILCGCACTPYGPKYILYPFSYLNNVHLQTRITEWAGTIVRDVLQLEVVIVAVLALCALVPLASPLEEVGLASVSLHFAFQALRNVYLIGPWLAPLIGPRLDALMDRIAAEDAPADAPAASPPAASPPAAVPAQPGLFAGEPVRDRVSWAWVVIFAIAIVRLAIGHQPPVQSVHPVKIVEWMKQNDVPNPLFNEYAQGGYIMFHLRARNKVHTDGRADLHIDSGAFEEYMNLIDLKSGWEDVFKKRGFRSALLETSMPITAQLKARGWKKIGPDEAGFDLLVAP